MSAVVRHPCIVFWQNISAADAKDVFALLKGREKTVKSGEEPTFTWFKSGQEFDPEDRFKVLFKDEEDTLALVFQVENHLQLTFTLYVQYVVG